MLVSENSNSQNSWREATSNVVHLLHGDLTWRRRKNETQSIGSESNRQQCVVLVGNATDFNEHVCEGTTRDVVNAVIRPGRSPS